MLTANIADTEAPLHTSPHSGEMLIPKCAIQHTRVLARKPINTLCNIEEV